MYRNALTVFVCVLALCVFVSSSPYTYRVYKQRALASRRALTPVGLRDADKDDAGNSGHGDDDDDDDDDDDSQSEARSLDAISQSEARNLNDDQSEARSIDAGQSGARSVKMGEVKGNGHAQNSHAAYWPGLTAMVRSLKKTRGYSGEQHLGEKIREDSHERYSHKKTRGYSAELAEKTRGYSGEKTRGYRGEKTRGYSAELSETKRVFRPLMDNKVKANPIQRLSRWYPSKYCRIQVYGGHRCYEKKYSDKCEIPPGVVAQCYDPDEDSDEYVYGQAVY